MTNKEKLINLAVDGLKKRGIYSKKHMARLISEFKGVSDLSEHDYFLNLVESGKKYSYNEHNLLLAYVLGIVDDFDIEQPAASFMGEFPDTDVDYIKEVRDYLKEDWAPKEFGRDKVCWVGNYTTFGIKSSLIDMARVFGLDRQEILNITTKLPSVDEDGKPLTLEKAKEISPGLQEYCKAYPDATNAADRLLNRNRGMGTHAGGLIISKSPIDNFIPLVKGKDGAPVSAFVEGLHGTDLGPLGLVKFDLLVVDLYRIYACCKLIKDRHNVETICALLGQKDFSDTSYLNDSKAIAIANEAKLKCVFQFDSDGMRELIKKGGVTSFDDLVAYTSLFRPGPMGMGMHDEFVRRKKGEEDYWIHPVIEPILGVTYGIMVYQEQVMKILNVVGDIPLAHCEKVRKAISKKKEEVFVSYKEAFVENGQKVLDWTKDKVEILWDQIASFAEYGFNKSHATAYTYISSRMLWLKAHYPIEFFAATLSCEGMGNKVKEYKVEAERCGIKVNRVDINNSGWTFEIRGNEIYMGFSNIKGIGEEIAQRIVASQPYSSFEDFLARFGTDAKVLKPLIGLNLFEKDGDRKTLYEFYEYYKDKTKKRENRNIRNKKSRSGIVDEFRYILYNEYKDKTEEILKSWIDLEDKEAFQQVASDMLGDVDTAWKTFRKYKRNVTGIQKKIVEDEDIILSTFVPKGEINPKVAELYNAIPQTAEREFYGFAWDHILEYSDDYRGGYSFDGFEDETKLVLPIEAQIIEKTQKKLSKKGTEYYIATIEDANGVTNRVTIWEEDYQRFEKEFEYWDEENSFGNLVRIKLERPGPGFRSFTFDSPPKYLRHKLIPEDKSLDGRLMVLAFPKIEEKKFVPVKPQEQEILVIDGGVELDLNYLESL